MIINSLKLSLLDSNDDNPNLLLENRIINNIKLDMDEEKKSDTKINWNKYKIKDLQDMALKFNIDITKTGKTKIVNKTKDDLIIDLKKFL